VRALSIVRCNGTHLHPATISRSGPPARPPRRRRPRRARVPSSRCRRAAPAAAGVARASRRFASSLPRWSMATSCSTRSDRGADSTPRSESRHRARPRRSDPLLGASDPPPASSRAPRGSRPRAAPPPRRTHPTEQAPWPSARAPTSMACAYPAGLVGGRRLS
jgi:hypothetical protein